MSCKPSRGLSSNSLNTSLPSGAAQAAHYPAGTRGGLFSLNIKLLVITDSEYDVEN